MSKKNNSINNEPERSIEDMSMQEILDKINSRNKKTPKEKIWAATKWILLLGPRMLGAIFGIDKETINSYSRRGARRGSRDDDYYVPHPPSSTESFRDNYRVHGWDPYTYNPIEAENLRNYLKGQDGMGDPQPHHHHDHDDR